jgi:MFS family permease
MAGGGVPIGAPTLASGYLTGRALVFPICLVISLFFLWGFSYGLLDVLNKHFQTVLGITKLQSTGLQVVYFGGGYLLFSPVAAEVMKRKGYKITILMGLSLYSLGAIFFCSYAFDLAIKALANVPRAYCSLHNLSKPYCIFRRLLCLHLGHCLRSCHSRDCRQLLCRRHW